MKNFKAVSMDCNEEQFESMREELIELGCEFPNEICIWTDFPILINNLDGISKKVGNINISMRDNYNREYIGAFDKEAFLKACGKVEEVTGKRRNRDKKLNSRAKTRKQCKYLYEKEKELNKEYINNIITLREIVEEKEDEIKSLHGDIDSLKNYNVNYINTYQRRLEILKDRISELSKHNNEPLIKNDDLEKENIELRKIRKYFTIGLYLYILGLLIFNILR